MKLKPMPSKIAAVAILIAVTGAITTPAHAAEEKMPAPVTQTLNKYGATSFEAPVFDSPKVASWAVAYTPQLSNKTQLDPAEKALLANDAQLAQKQKTIVEKDAAVVRAEIKRIAAEKAAIKKAAEEKAAAEKIAAEEAAAETAKKAAAETAEAARVAAAAKKVAAEKARATNIAVAGKTSAGVKTQKASSPTASSAIGASLVASAYSQLGIRQDCTAMVEKALRSVGKSVGDIAPNGFYRYGTVVTNPQPGDLMIKSGHVAIYVGNGMAISGGFNNYNTELHPASYISGSTFVRVS